MPLQKRGKRPNEGHLGASRGSPRKRGRLVSMLPIDTEYADDVDFNDEEEENLRAILPQATAICYTREMEPLCQ